MREIFYTFLLFASVLFVHAQNDTVPTNENKLIEKIFPKIPDSIGVSVRKNIFSFRLGYTPFLGVNYEYVLTPRLGMDLFAGLFGAGAGANFYYPGLHKIIGLKIGFQGSYNSIPWVGNGTVFYAPFGFYLAHKGFFMFLDVGPQTDPFNSYGNFGYSLGLAKRFG